MKMSSEIEQYIAGLPAVRKKRVTDIRKAFLGAMNDIEETMRYRMPTYEKGANWAAVGSRKNYLSVYFCSEEMIRNIKRKHPGIITGKGCVRIKDHQEVPIKDLVVSFRKAMSDSKQSRDRSS